MWNRSRHNLLRSHTNFACFISIQHINTLVHLENFKSLIKSQEYIYLFTNAAGLNSPGIRRGPEGCAITDRITIVFTFHSSH